MAQGIIHKHNIDLDNNQALNLVLEKVSSLPSTNLVAGRIVYNTSDNIYYVYNGSTWDSLSDKENAFVKNTAFNKDFGTTAGTVLEGNSTFNASKIVSGTFDINRIPKTAINTSVSVADETARFALTTANVQNGDEVFQLDTNKRYAVTDDSNLDSELGYTEFFASSNWSTITDKPQNILDISAISASENDLIQYKSGSFVNRTPTELKSDLSLVKGDVGLSNVDNTSDLSKPISNATQTALDLKQDKEAGKGLSTNDYDNTEKAKVADSFQKSTDTLDDVLEGSTNKHYTSTIDSRLENTSGTNTGDETQSTIKTKLGEATNSADGYMTQEQVQTLEGLDSAVNSFQVSFVSGDFVSNVLTISNATHGLGTGKFFQVKVYDSSGVENMALVSINTVNGDVKYEVSSGNAFDGTIVISK